MKILTQTSVPSLKCSKSDRLLDAANATAAREIEDCLRRDGQLGPGPALLTPLGGGVSCEIFKVEQGNRKFVVKRALAQLRVAAEWRADVSRNAVEYAFYETLAAPLAGALPEVFFHSPEHGYFTMECLDGEWSNWKELLLQGGAEPLHGALAGTLMGKLHRSTWGNGDLAARFETTANFRQLRTDPYLRTVAEKRGEVRPEFLDEAARLEGSRVCLVHGDFSPKNLLIHGHRMVLLDAEVAWFGDPAFDVAFLHSHLFLKGLHRSPVESAWAETSRAAWQAYAREMDGHCGEELEKRSARLLVMLILARVDGKSPVEYLTAPKQAWARAFAVAALHGEPTSLDAVREAWREQLALL